MWPLIMAIMIFFSTNLRSDGLPTRSPPWGRIKFGPFFRPALGTQQRVTDSNACRAGTATEALWGGAEQRHQLTAGIPLPKNMGLQSHLND